MRISATRRSVGVFMPIKCNTRVSRGGYRTGTMSAGVETQESKSFRWGRPESRGLAGGESTDSGGEGYEAAFRSPSRGETGTEGGWTLMWRSWD